MPVILLHALDLCHENNYYIFSTDLKSMFVNLLMNDTFFFQMSLSVSEFQTYGLKGCLL